MSLCISVLVIAVVFYIVGYETAKRMYFDRGYNACYMQLLTNNINHEDSLKKCKEFYKNV